MATCSNQTRANGSGVARGAGGGGICPRAPPGGGRQNPAKKNLKIYIWRNFLKPQRIE